MEKKFPALGVGAGLSSTAGVQRVWAYMAVSQEVFLVMIIVRKEGGC